MAKAIEKMIIKQKGLKDYLADDPSLTEKFTYEELYGEKDATPISEDVTIEEAYNAYIEK